MSSLRVCWRSRIPPLGIRSSAWPSAGTLRVERWQLDLLADRDRVHERETRAGQASATTSESVTTSEREDTRPKAGTIPSAPAAHHPVPRKGSPREPWHAVNRRLLAGFRRGRARGGIAARAHASTRHHRARPTSRGPLLLRTFNKLKQDAMPPCARTPTFL
jgi:hypothetical protein